MYFTGTCANAEEICSTVKNLEYKYAKANNAPAVRHLHCHRRSWH
jgi:hypothetical protein